MPPKRLPKDRGHKETLGGTYSGEKSGWFPTGKFLGKDVPKGSRDILDILTLATLGGIPAMRGKLAVPKGALRKRPPLAADLTKELGALRDPAKFNTYRYIMEKGRTMSVGEAEALRKSIHEIRKIAAMQRRAKNLKKSPPATRPNPELFRTQDIAYKRRPVINPRKKPPLLQPYQRVLTAERAGRNLDRLVGATGSKLILEELDF